MSDHVFICYSRLDQDFVIELAKNLKDRGVPVWLDKWSIPTGANWPQKIEEALITCARLLVVLSPAAVESTKVQAEWLKVLEDRKVVIPVLYQECNIPYLLKPIQYIDFTSRSTNKDVAFNDMSVALGIAENNVTMPAEISESNVRTPAHSIPASMCINLRGSKYPSIQEAVDDAEPGDTVTMEAGIHYEIIKIDKSLTIVGSGAENCIVDGGYVGSVITVGSEKNVNIDVILSGVTVKGGIGTSVSVDDNDASKYICGGGILNYGKLTITDCIISDNTANYGYGGGIFNKGIVTLNKGTFVTKNSAYNGGGIYGNRGSINLNGGNVISNQASQLGGGIYTGYMGSVNVHNGTIGDNVSGNNGGGIYSQDGSVILCRGII
jgi:hypothetical protein